MPTVAYVSKRFKPTTLATIERVNQIVEEYQSQGLVMTLRQLYYQFVARDWIPNTQASYDNLGSIVNDGRLAGLIDWDAIEDRTRGAVIPTTWSHAGAVIRSAAHWFEIDKWSNQPNRCEVWIEKEALAGVVESACQDLSVPFLACRGYTSQSEMWRAARRLRRNAENDQSTIIIHLGDHDPSGLDMTRDIRDRFDIFLGDSDDGPDVRETVSVERIALNMDQIRRYRPPPNPAKKTDCRFETYKREYKTDKSWELDALDPATLVQLVNDAVLAHRDPDLWAEREAEEREGKSQLQQCSTNWPGVVGFLDKLAAKRKRKGNDE